MAQLNKDASGNTAFDLQRQQVNAQAERDRKSRLEAVNRQLASQGISDSGIALAQNRLANADVSSQAAGERGNINIAELGARENLDESERGRRFTALESKLGRDSNEKLGFASLKTTERGQDITRDISREGDLTTRRGQDITKGIATQSDVTDRLRIDTDAKIATDRLGLDSARLTSENKRFYAELGQTYDLAQQGYTLEQSAQALTEKGINNDLALGMAGLSQAKYLAEKGFDIEAIKSQLVQQGMSDENARFYAGLSQDKELMQQEADLQVEKLFIGEAVANLNPDDPNFINKLNVLAELFGAELAPFTRTDQSAATTSTNSTWQPKKTSDKTIGGSLIDIGKDIGSNTVDTITAPSKFIARKLRKLF